MAEPKRASVGRPPSMEAPREFILANAARLFAEKGFEQTSLQDVAKAVGVSKAAVYHYFQSKQAIYDEIVVGLLERLFEYVRERVESEDLAEQKLAIFMRSHAEYFEANYVAFVTLLHAVGGIGAELRSGRQIVVRDQYEMLLRDVLGEGVSTGRFVIDDIAICARGILSMLNWMSRWYRPGGAKSAVEIVQQYYRMLYQGLRTS